MFVQLYTVEKYNRERIIHSCYVWYFLHKTACNAFYFTLSFCYHFFFFLFLFIVIKILSSLILSLAPEQSLRSSGNQQNYPNCLSTNFKESRVSRTTENSKGYSVHSITLSFFLQFFPWEVYTADRLSVCQCSPSSLRNVLTCCLDALIHSEPTESSALRYRHWPWRSSAEDLCAD